MVWWVTSSTSREARTMLPPKQMLQEDTLKHQTSSTECTKYRVRAQTLSSPCILPLHLYHGTLDQLGTNVQWWNPLLLAFKYNLCDLNQHCDLDYSASVASDGIKVPLASHSLIVLPALGVLSQTWFLLAPLPSYPKLLEEFNYLTISAFIFEFLALRAKEESLKMWPLRTHWKAEGNTKYASLLAFPSHDFSSTAHDFWVRRKACRMLDTGNISCWSDVHQIIATVKSAGNCHDAKDDI